VVAPWIVSRIAIALIYDHLLPSFLRSFLGGLEDDELLLDDDEDERRFFDFPLCFFTFLNHYLITFSFSRLRMTMKIMNRNVIDFFYVF
jgi:hypothetical protein